MELKFRVKEYNLYGRSDEYLDITFESVDGGLIKVSRTKNTPFIVERVEYATIEFVNEVFKIINNNLLVLSLEVEYK
jgi:hypothetical protein